MRVQNLFYGVAVVVPHAIYLWRKEKHGKENCKKDRKKSCKICGNENGVRFRRR